MRISIFGLGYVGTVTSACFARLGHQVTGVDVNLQKVALLNDGKSPIVEEAIGELVQQQVQAGRLRATTDIDTAIANSELSLICVGTPSNGNGSLSLSSVLSVSRSIAQALRAKKEDHLVVVRSTVVPGTVNRQIIPLMERESGKSHGRGFSVCFNPEFLREGSSVKDFESPPFTLVGTRDQACVEKVRELYAGVAAPFYVSSLEVAETVKYASNIYHAVKITFANELGAYCKSLGIDSHEVMNLFALDTKLNISRAYLRPGFAFGGSCLPKDLRALLYHAKSQDLSLPLLEAVLPSNERHLQRVVEMVLAQGKRRIGILGLSFKAGTDDLRESPLVWLTETLLGKGYELRILDRDVAMARLMGGNKEYIEKEIPHLSSLLCRSLEEIVAFAELIIIGNGNREYAAVFEKRKPEQVVIDLVRMLPDNGSSQPNYHGVCW
ncbi:MAG: UDP-glucose/GDP-mannose dehydrogenase family protein [candidate division KSB1 bacterium]|nr:UDP-glucose/GDP-mannose dehydrogenase family protein [candidate division KSB1 bacterium]MDZ7272780.1 UDP-glucose/GDP-mannose dehydrogenase family protein [candidate division KSB1 bacterium]MDZ7284196.1 UDP-glucose/GDP-mannose dehydrogenase family protein [candidate division KSB1 bacterium]MDZ7297406.1 UDP-glucose/GDP-mannose dehydrogenase family protein [candidate division KSB1 bacterium]MDZ7306534.1 UDP-glucose/GDP-mannose dehydrogenase family protein [candidate division KSB1 bacterium]